MKNKPKFLDVNYETWKIICQDTLFNIDSILKSVKILLDKNIKDNEKILWDHPYIAAGLYTFAIEEYGKFLILSSITEHEGVFRIKYKNEFISHPKKFKKALESIPEDCKLIYKGSFGKGFGSGFDIDEIADSDARFKILYSDFNEKQELQKMPQVNATSLLNSVNQFTILFEKIMMEFHEKYIKSKE